MMRLLGDDDAARKSAWTRGLQDGIADPMPRVRMTGRIGNDELVEKFGRMRELEAVDRCRGVARTLFVAIVVLLGFAQLVPLAFAGLTEGFQSMTIALADDVAAGRGLVSDLAYPFNAEFYYVSRYGLVALLSLVQPWLLHHLAGGIAALMIGALLLYVVTTLIFVRRIFGVKTGWSIAAIVLCPVVAQSAYSLNDSLPGAALVATAFGLWSIGRRLVAAIAAGVVLGCAIVLRFDSAFVMPAFVALAWWQQGVSRAALTRIVAFGLTALAVASALYGTGGLTILDPPLIARTAIALWSEPVSLAHPAKVLAVAFTVAAWLAAVLGLTVLWRRDGRLAVVVGIAFAGYLLPYALSLYQPRYLLPVAPFIVALAATGMQAAFARHAGHWWRAVSLGAVSLLVLLPVVGGQSEGPRAVTGNVWNALGWARWLGMLGPEYDAALNRVASAAGGSATIVSTGWSEERLTHLGLIQAGFVPLPLAGQGHCALARQLYRRDERTVAHVRLDVPFTGATAGAVNDSLVKPCWPAWGGIPARLLLVSAAEDETAGGLFAWLVRGAGTNWLPRTMVIEGTQLESYLPAGEMTADRYRSLMKAGGQPPLLRARPLTLGTPRFLSSLSNQ